MRNNHEIVIMCYEDFSEANQPERVVTTAHFKPEGWFKEQLVGLLETYGKGARDFKRAMDAFSPK